MGSLGSLSTMTTFGRSTATGKADGDKKRVKVLDKSSRGSSSVAGTSGSRSGGVFTEQENISLTTFAQTRDGDDAGPALEYREANRID